jgi:peptidoglycan/LPS O-acetylase OafA/YrhL
MTIESLPAPTFRLDSLQLLRAVAALLVLLYHLATMGVYGWIAADGSPLLPLGFFAAIGFAGVDLFFVISGVVMVVTCFDRFGQPGEAIAFLKRRIVRIYPLYWIVTAAVLALCWLRPELAARDKTGAAAILASLVLWPQTDFPIVAVGWTLVYEMYFYLVFAVIIAAPRRMLPPLLAAWAAATVALLAMWESPDRPLTAQGYLLLPPFASPLVLEFIRRLECPRGRRRRRAWPHAPCAPQSLMWQSSAPFGDA